jgi:hypothetical protein
MNERVELNNAHPSQQRSDQRRRPTVSERQDIKSSTLDSGAGELAETEIT